MLFILILIFENVVRFAILDNVVEFIVVSMFTSLLFPSHTTLADPETGQGYNKNARYGRIKKNDFRLILTDQLILDYRKL